MHSLCSHSSSQVREVVLAAIYRADVVCSWISAMGRTVFSVQLALHINI
jgi:hypothetical protein